MSYNHSLTLIFDEQLSPELVYLAQITGIDGEDPVLYRAPLFNGSGRQIGELLTISHETWEFIQESIRREEELEED